MKHFLGITFLVLIPFVFCQSLSALDHRIRINVGADLRLFPSPSAENENDYFFNGTAFVKPNYELFLWDGTLAFLIQSTHSVDQHDSSRTFNEFEDLKFELNFDLFTLTLGRNVEFWGVTESQQVVNILNQINLSENIYGDYRLGQTMVKFALQSEFGDLSLYILPEFRKRVFPSQEGRPASRIRINEDLALYENKDEEKHTDYAIRYTGNADVHDFALSYFIGTSREPTLSPSVTSSGVELIPYYYQMKQTGLEWQTTLESLLLKLEIVYREIENDDYTAGTTGFEYTIFNMLATGSDLGLFFEYLFDEREDQTFLNTQNDIFAGMRWTANDQDDTSAIIGFSIDNEDNTSFTRMQLEKRIVENMKISTDATFILFADKNNIIYRNRRDGFFNVRFEYFY